MYHVLKWAHLHTRMVFAPDEGGAGTASTTPSSSSGDGGGSSVSAPSDGGSGNPSATPPSPDSSPSETASPWEALGDTYSEDDTLELPAATPEPAPAPAPVAPAPVAPAPAAPAATPTPAAAAPTPPPAQPTSPTAPAAPQLSPADPVAIADAMHADRDAVIAHLAQSRFALSEADVAELETDAATAVPKLLARAFLESQMTTYRFLAQAVPGMIQKHSTVSKANATAEDQFFTAHKALGLDPNNAKHRETATRIATIYRQSNPSIPLAQLIAEVGPMVATALALQPGAVTQPTPAAGLPRGAPTGFRPAVGGGGASPAPAAPNEWEMLGAPLQE